MDLPGYEQLLAQMRGTPLVVNFWASWCAPCREETPLLVDAHARYVDRVQFLGVDILDARDSAVRFVTEFSMDYPSVFDPQNEIGLTYDLFAPPMTLFIDREGRVVATVPGEISPDDLEQNLQLIAA
jgi:cytochrome c biogenesis protein CcmG/thiol:disulfide interchange protein DsbE